MDSTEFLKFVEQNETAVNITTYMDQETNKLLRWAVNRRARCGRKGCEKPAHGKYVRACTNKANSV